MRMFFPRKAASRFALPLLCFVLALAGLSGCAKAASTVSARLRPDMSIVIDGSARDFYNASGQEVHPILYDGTTYLPVRAIGELMGKNVDWNQTTKTVTLSGSRTAASTAGAPDTAARAADVAAEIRDDFTVVVDGVTRTFADANGKTVYPRLYSGSTYLPVRAVGELMGKTVAWDGGAGTVTLSGGLVTDADSFSGGTGTGTAPSAPAPAGLISLEDAKAKALEHAGVAAGGASFVEQELGWDDGRQIYEIEFYTAGGKEYDYEIDAKTGEILEFDYDAEHMPSFTDSDGKPLTTIITREKAQEIALAKVPGANASHVVKCKTDTENGRPVYEVEIVYNTMEYDFEIDAATGTILEMDADRND